MGLLKFLIKPKTLITAGIGYGAFKLGSAYGESIPDSVTAQSRVDKEYEEFLKAQRKYGINPSRNRTVFGRLFG